MDDRARRAADVSVVLKKSGESTHAISRDTDISPTTIGKVIKGHVPNERTLERLEKWAEVASLPASAWPSDPAGAAGIWQAIAEMEETLNRLRKRAERIGRVSKILRVKPYEPLGGEPYLDEAEGKEK